MNFRGTKRLIEVATMGGAHDLIHTLLEENDNVINYVNKILSEHNHHTVTYGDFRSGLHLHLLTHALNWEWPIYFRTENGQLHKAETVHRYVDTIGRVGQAVVFDVRKTEEITEHD